MSTLSIRRERVLPTGTPANYGHDTVLFGLFRNDRFWVADVNNTRLELIGAGLDSAAALDVMDAVAFDDKAFDVAAGSVTEL